MSFDKNARRQKIRAKIRGKINGSAEKPRLSVFRSNKYIYAQIVDDAKGHTLVSVSSREAGLSEAIGTKLELSKNAGKRIAEKALAAGITDVVFDRGGYLYHGRVKALAEGAREGGLAF